MPKPSTSTRVETTSQKRAPALFQNRGRQSRSVTAALSPSLFPAWKRRCWQPRDGLFKAASESVLGGTPKGEEGEREGTCQGKKLWRRMALPWAHCWAWGRSLPLSGPHLPQYLVGRNCAGSGVSNERLKTGSITYDQCALVKLLNLWAWVFSFVRWGNNSTYFLELLWGLNEIM